MFRNAHDGAKSVSIRNVVETFCNIRTGNENKIPCPLHQETEGSFHIYDSSNSFYCYGCHVGGSPIDFVLLLKEKQNQRLASSGEAAKLICDKFGIQYQNTFSKDSDYDNYVKVYKFVADLFVDSNKLDNALAYWQSRKLDRLIKDYQLGYCPAVFTGKDNTVISLKDKLRREFPEIPEATLDSYGLYDRHGHCVFSERYMFAIRNSRGDVVAFSGRDATGNSPAKYKNSQETKYFQKKKILYNFDNAKSYSSIYVVEGQADALSLIAVGIQNVVASLGTAFGEDHLSLLKGKEVIFAFDNDEAAYETTLKFILNKPVNRYLNVFMLGEYKDFNEALIAGFDFKHIFRRRHLMYAPDYLFKLFCTLTKKLQASSEDEYEELKRKPIYLDLSLAEDKDKFKSYMDKATSSKYCSPIQRYEYALRVSRLIKGKRMEVKNG